jgi:hypothetical protein
MNKRYLENNIGKAREAIENCPGIDKTDKQLRSKMAAFGATVISSGILAAIAYYHENARDIERLLAKMYCGDYEKDLFKAVYDKVKLSEDQDGRITTEYLRKKEEITERILNDSVCLKMAFNFFVRDKKDENRNSERQETGA